MHLSHAKQSIAVREMSQPSEDMEDCIIAKLASVDFERHVLRFKHGLSDNLLKVKCDQDNLQLRKSLAEAGGAEAGFLEIYGSMKFRRDGSPSKISSLTGLKQVNLDEVLVTEVSTDKGVIAPSEPLAFHPELSEHKAIYVVDISPFGSILFEQNRECLVEVIHDYLAFMWGFYALEEDKSLDPGALEIKKAALETFKWKGD